jgi:hypothetical protein
MKVKSKAGLGITDKTVTILAFIVMGLVLLMIGTVVSAEARFCVSPESPVGQAFDKLIKMGKMELLLQPNNQTMKEATANLTKAMVNPVKPSAYLGTLPHKEIVVKVVVTEVVLG